MWEKAKHTRAPHLMMWVSMIVENKNAPLNSEAKEALRTIYHLADARVSTYSQFLKLKGRLEFQIAKISNGSNKPESAATKPLVVFNAKDA